MKTLRQLGDFLNLRDPDLRNPDLNIISVEADSRLVEDGALFVCIRGDHADGHRYALQAVEAGAAAVLCEEELAVDVPQFIVADTKEAIRRIAPWFHDRPADRLKMIGITGTNGKTTTAYLVHHVLSSLGIKSGMIGTVSVHNGNESVEAHLTTPQPHELQKHLSDMVDNGCRAAVMEVSSHALAMGRADGISFDYAGFSNLTQDHLDYHETMEAYRAAKGLLFARSPGGSVINCDDEAGSYMAGQAGGPVLYYSAEKQLPDGISASEIELRADGTTFRLDFRGKSHMVRAQLIGRFNVYNMMLAFGLSVLCGISAGDACAAIESFKPVAGRFMTVPVGADFAVVVDYAHTPDALENVLRTARDITTGRIITVFGCGGDRDRTKRPLMGAITSRFSDLAVLTSDNPRSEDPDRIISDVLAGIEDRDGVHVVTDRREAIRTALGMAEDGDLIMIAGKGHETYQILASGKIDFDDSAVVTELWKEMAGDEKLDR